MKNKDLFKEDSTGITRPIRDEEKERHGIWFKDNNTIMHLTYSNIQDALLEAEIVIENELIPLYLQIIIDTNIWNTKARNTTNLKKLYEMICMILWLHYPKKNFLISILKSSDKSTYSIARCAGIQTNTIAIYHGIWAIW